MKSKKVLESLVGLIIVTTFCCTVNAQRIASAAATVVPQLVNYSGRALDEAGKPIAGVATVTFSIYEDQYGGSPLWMETQNVQPDVRGNYTVQLGATSSQGLPLDLFSSGEARWLDVRVNSEKEQPRVLLLSVPYALKAADAQTLSGLPASAFALAGSAGSNAQTTQSATASNTASAPNVGGSGTQDYIPLWTDSSGDLGNSIVYQTGSGSSAKIGINLTKPLFTLDVNGQELVRGLFEMATTNYANKSKGYNSNPINLESSAFNSSSGKYTLNHFQWQAEPTGNNTSTPGATLNLLYGTDPNQPAETGLSVNSQGIFTFAPGQTFPGGGGTVTSVGLSAPSSDFTVSGSPVTTNGTLDLNWTVPPTSDNVVNAIVKRNSNGGFVVDSITANTIITNEAIQASNNGNNISPITGTDTSVDLGLAGVSGVSINGSGVYGSGSTGVAGLGLYGMVGSSTEGIGVSGDSVYGTGVYGLGTTGVYGSGTTGNGVTAYNTAGGYGVYSYSSGYTAYLDGPKGHCHVDGSGNLACTGSKSAVVPVDDGSRHVALYAVEAPENWFEDFGSATLSNGKVLVSLDPTFAQTVNTDVEYHVFLTPDGDSRGLYLAAKSPTSFEVHEQGGGTSNIAFDYRIVARRKGYENIRLADLTKEFTKRPQSLPRLVVPPIPPVPMSKPSGLPTKAMLRTANTNGGK